MCILLVILFLVEESEVINNKLLQLLLILHGQGEGNLFILSTQFLPIPFNNIAILQLDFLFNTIITRLIFHKLIILWVYLKF